MKGNGDLLVPFFIMLGIFAWILIMFIRSAR
jgi:hypothetical protein